MSKPSRCRWGCDRKPVFFVPNKWIGMSWIPDGYECEYHLLAHGFPAGLMNKEDEVTE